jgi:hypothetical protein
MNTYKTSGSSSSSSRRRRRRREIAINYGERISGFIKIMVCVISLICFLPSEKREK